MLIQNKFFTDLLDISLNIVIIQPGDILLQAADDFQFEAVGLNNYNEWMHAKKEFRLYHKLRVTLYEIETLFIRVMALRGSLLSPVWKKFLSGVSNLNQNKKLECTFF